MSAWLRARFNHASIWSTVSGVGTMAFNAVTIPVLYFCLEKQDFAEWVSAMACLNLWCFPEAAKLILVTSGAIGADRQRQAKQQLFLLMAYAAAAGTLVLQYFRLSESETVWVWHRLLPMMVLMPAIPLRFEIAEMKGRLQAAGKWKLYATLINRLNFFTSGAILLAAFVFRDVSAIALAYLLMLSFQRTALKSVLGAQTEGVAVNAEWKQENGTGILGTLLISLGPLLFSQGDKFGLRFILSDSDYAEYAFCIALVGQVNVLGALPCVPLARWKMQTVSEQKKQMFISQIMNVFMVAAAAVALVAAFYLLQHYDTDLLAGRVSADTLLPAIIIYGIIALNAPGYYVLIGRGDHVLVGWVNLVIAVLSLTAIFGFAHTLGLWGAILGNAVYCLTIVWCLVAYRRIQVDHQD